MFNAKNFYLKKPLIHTSREQYLFNVLLDLLISQLPNLCTGIRTIDLLAATHYPPPISVLVWVRSFIQPDVLKTMYCSRIPLRFI